MILFAVLYGHSIQEITSLDRMGGMKIYAYTAEISSVDLLTTLLKVVMCSPINSS
ncbi:Uncharacterised protein [Yersinia enterocolitica]|nr:Uncharacterised protein [Yersinia enterocolitica]